MDSHHGRPAMMRLRAFEKLLFEAGCVYEKSESSHHFYRTPSGRRVHLCGHQVGPKQQKEIRRLLDDERRAHQQHQQRQQGERDNHAR